MLAFAVHVHLTGTISLGDLIVGIGTLALAYFTSRLASATYKLDARTAARERTRRERQARGVARLVDGELAVVEETLELALDGHKWSFGWSIPHRAWDRDGTLIAETVPEDEALALIRLFAELRKWESAVELLSAKASAKTTEIGLGNPSGAVQVSDRLANILGQVKDARRDLRKLAYPDGRDLAPDPDRPLPRRRFLLFGPRSW